MEISIETAIPVLEGTPATLRTMLSGLPEAWLMNNEGGDSWSPYEVVGHLTSLEGMEWIPRVKIILEQGTSRAFDKVDHLATLGGDDKSLEDLLDEFAEVRAENIATLRSMNLTDEDLLRPGKHPSLGEVNLGQLLSTWVVHDLNHIHQVAQTMARQYKEAVGPWHEYLGVL